MVAVSRASSAAEGFQLPFRLRSVVGVLFVAMAAWWAYPRATAAVELHTLGNQFADYALCMVGPVGPNLLRDHPEDFLKLVHRRLVISAAGDRPFEGCALGAKALTGSEEVEQAHRAPAWFFAEYGARGWARGANLRVDQLKVTTRRLGELSKAAWPFYRGGYSQLIKRSSHAPEATHPAELPAPVLGRGLPAWRARYRSVSRSGAGWAVAFGSGALLSVYQSVDGGLSWTSTSREAVDADRFSERCAAGERSFAFDTDDDGAHTTVVSVGMDTVPSVATLAPAKLEVFAAACDRDVLVVALKPERGRDVTLKRCQFRGSCEPLALPTFEGTNHSPRYPLDLARVGGATVLAVNMGPVVRVASTRDDTVWSPFTVAYDSTELPGLSAHVLVPRRLLALGNRLLLYGGAPEAKQTYPVLVSDDQGATWRTPADPRSVGRSPGVPNL